MIDRRRFARIVVAGPIIPLVARAQGATTARHIGILYPGSRAQWSTADVQRRLAAELNELGWVEGGNVVFERRFADGNPARLRSLADELVALKMEMIVTYGTDATAAAKSATTSIPIVIGAAGDPVGMGLVASLARPGGNITGYSNVYPEVAKKRAALLRELLPTARRVGVLLNPGGPAVERLQSATGKAYHAVGFEPFVLEVDSEARALEAMAQAARRGAEALDINLAIGVTSSLMQAALRSRLPAMCNGRRNVEAGGLIALNPDEPEQYRRLAAIMDKILRGAKPADIPIEQPTKFLLVINLKTAKALGLPIPQSLLLRADEVFQ